MVQNFLAQVNPAQRSNVPTFSASQGVPHTPMVPSMTNLQDTPFGDIAERIRWHRSLEGLEQREYAERAGLNRAQLSNWETGNYRVSIDGALKLRETYGLSLDFIYVGNFDTLPMTLRAAWLSRPEVNASK